MSTSEFSIVQDGRLYDYSWSEDMVLTRRSRSLNEAAIGALRQRVRSAGGARPTDWQQPLFSLSPDEYEMLCRLKPALKSPDKQEQKRAWLSLARDVDFYKLGLRDR